MNEGELKSEILRLTRDYARLVGKQKEFIPGVTPIPYAGRVYDFNEVAAAVDSSLNFWLTLGPKGIEFENEFTNYLGVKRTVICNSGSSANLLAISALTSPTLGNRALKPGDEVITAACGFPTTVAPIIQNGCIPVFIDSDPRTLNPLMSQMLEALSPKTKAVIFAHSLGNPLEIGYVKTFCDKHNLWLIEDNCDSLGSRVDGRLTGTFGDLSTQSFFPAHHITMGEGGCVSTNSRELASLLEIFRDWGRDCWCATGKDNTCHKRFGWKLGSLPDGYDHKYIYSHLGYNLKPTDIQAAIGVEQLEKLPGFVESRKRNWDILREGLSDLEHVFDFQTPLENAIPSWFGFMMLVKETAPFKRNDLIQFLESKKIASRMMFGGNLTRQPAFMALEKNRYRVVGNLAGADKIMNQALFIGVYPGLTKEMIAYMIESIHHFVLCSGTKVD